MATIGSNGATTKGCSEYHSSLPEKKAFNQLATEVRPTSPNHNKRKMYSRGGKEEFHSVCTPPYTKNYNIIEIRDCKESTLATPTTVITTMTLFSHALSINQLHC